MKKSVLVGIAVLAVLGAVLLYFGMRPHGRLVLVTLPPGPPQPRVPVGEAGLDPAVLQAAVAYAEVRNTRALVVGRGGHIVFEKYWGDTTADSLVDPGFSPVLAALAVGAALNDRQIAGLDVPLSNYVGDAAGEAGQATVRELLEQRRPDLAPGQSVDLLALLLERVGRKAYPQLLAEKLWAPLGGGTLEFRSASGGLRPGGVDAACCVRASIGDWMRVAEALANDGVFEANQLTPPGYVQQMLAVSRPDQARGYFTRVGGRFAAHDLAWLEGSNQQRLWIVPSLRLTMLRVGDAAGSRGWVEEMIPDTIVRGTSGWQPRKAGEGVDPNRFAPH